MTVTVLVVVTAAVTEDVKIHVTKAVMENAKAVVVTAKANVVMDVTMVVRKAARRGVINCVRESAIHHVEMGVQNRVEDAKVVVHITVLPVTVAVKLDV